MTPVKIIAIIMLVSAVAKFGHPFRAAMVLGVIGAGLSLLGGEVMPTVVIQTAVSVVVGTVVFWLIDRTQSLLLWLIMMIAGAAVLILFG